MAKKNKKRNVVPCEQPVRPRVLEQQIIYAKVPSGIPIAKPASNIQLIPVVQPIAMVPYSTQAQPLSIMDEFEEEY